MCGIAGLILSSGAPPPDPAMLVAADRRLQHRGPDGTGHAVVGRVALVHNRLAIIDLVTGDQPLFAGPATLVCNGEIYNYRELRVAMPGVNFATNSDCEPPLHLWLREGPDYAQQLRGMYAIAIHERVAAHGDADARSVRHQAALHRADRRRPGVRVGTAGAAGSRPGGTHGAAGRARGTAATAVHHRRRHDLRRHPAPAAGRDADLRRRPRAGPRAVCRIFPRAGRRTSTRMRRWHGWTARWRKASICISAATCRTACSCRAASTAATLLALMARLNSQPVLAFTAGFDAPGAADEREHAATVAKALGAQHETIEITEEMVWRASARDRRLHGRSRRRITRSSRPGSWPGARGRT